MGVFNKSIFVSFCYVVAVIQAATTTSNPLVKEQKDKILTTRRQMECIEELRVDPDKVMKMKNGEWKDDNALLKQWVLCVLMKAGLMTREGVYRMDVAMAQAPEEHKKDIEKIIDECLSEKAIPAPIIAYNFVKCYHYKSKGKFNFASIF